MENKSGSRQGIVRVKVRIRKTITREADVCLYASYTEEESDLRSYVQGLLRNKEDREHLPVQFEKQLLATEPTTALTTEVRGFEVCDLDSVPEEERDAECWLWFGSSNTLSEEIENIKLENAEIGD